jgi:hypothetical protein
MTNLVFIEHAKVPKDHVKAIKQDLLSYAISIALKFPTDALSEVEKVKAAKNSVRTLLKRFDLSTKNLGTLLHDEVVSNLQDVYFKMKQQYRTLPGDLAEMIKIVRLLRKSQPRKYKKLYNSLQEQLTEKQNRIFNIYLKFMPKGKKVLTYKTVSRLSKIPAGTINPQIKKVVRSLNRLMKKNKIR